LPSADLFPHRLHLLAAELPDPGGQGRAGGFLQPSGQQWEMVEEGVLLLKIVIAVE
jgi:hypothetical protein